MKTPVDEDFIRAIANIVHNIEFAIDCGRGDNRNDDRHGNGINGEKRAVNPSAPHKVHPA